MQMILNFMSFSATEFCQNVSYLENTISLVQNWMSSNFLSLNPSKTEFLIIGLRQQLAKLSHPTISLPNSVTLCPVKSARNFGVIFYSSLSFSEHISAISKSCFSHIQDLTWIRLLRVPLLLLLLIPNLITIIHFCSIFLHLLQIVFSLYLTQLLMLSPKPPSFITLL
jgi:hypothetical protein